MAVLNKNKDMIPADAVYVGRGSVWGNHFRIGQDGSRDEVCEKYGRWLIWKIERGDITRAQLSELHGKDLVCYCAPLRCHGHTLEAVANWAVSKKSIQVRTDLD